MRQETPIWLYLVLVIVFIALILFMLFSFSNVYTSPEIVSKDRVADVTQGNKISDAIAEATEQDVIS